MGIFGITCMLVLANYMTGKPVNYLLKRIGKVNWKDKTIDLWESLKPYALKAGRTAAKPVLTLYGKMGRFSGKMGRLYFASFVLALCVSRPAFGTFSYPFHPHEKRQQVVSTYHGSANSPTMVPSYWLRVNLAH